VPEVDDDQLAALRRLRAGFGFVEVVEVIGHNPDDDLAATTDESMQEARMADPRRMTPEERRQAQNAPHPGAERSTWRTASQALDDLMRKLLEAEERLAKRKPSAKPT
jgi:hypothetical protein